VHSNDERNPLASVDAHGQGPRRRSLTTPRGALSQAHFQGALFYTGAMAGLALLDACAKLLVGDYGLAQVLFMRGAIAIIPIAFAIWLLKLPLSLPRQHIGLHVLRLVTIVIATALFFDALRYLHLGQAAAIGLIGPLVMTVLGSRRLGEPIDPGARLLLTAGCGAAVVALAPWNMEWGTAPWQGILGAAAATALYAVSMVQTRRLALAGEAATLLWCTPVGVCLIAAPFALGSWEATWTDDFAVFCGMGIFGGASTIFITLALRLAPVTVVAPFDYSIFVFAAILGFLIFGTRADAQILVGGLLLTGALFFRAHVAGQRFISESGAACWARLRPR